MNRRSFLHVAGVAAVGVVASCTTPTEYDERSLGRPELLAALGDGPVRAIGARYRALPAAERDAAALRSAILASRPISARLFGASSPSVSELVRDDFTHGRTVVLDGWVLALTEARQCALYSLRSA
jgi:hypothetical protein